MDTSPEEGTAPATDSSIAPPQASTPPAPSQKMDMDSRQSMLATTIASQVASGKRVESQGPYSAILVKGKPVNHVLNLILTVITAGLWVVVWVPWAILGGEKRSQASVDEFGNVSVANL